MKKFLKMQLVAIMALFVVVGLSVDAEAAAKKPYEYEFEVEGTKSGDVITPTKEYNGFLGAKQMVITFDKNINTINTSDVVVKQLIDETGTLEVVKNIIVSTPVITGTDNILIANKLAIKFENLEFVDYSKGMKFQLEIAKDTLYFDQLTAYEFPFQFYDLLPGFESTFITGDKSELINKNIFKHNAPRDVKIHIPKMYLTKIETIHRNTGVVGESNGPALTNIDVLADEEASRLTVSVNDNDEDQYSRDLEYRADVKGFSMGQAGLAGLGCVTVAVDKEYCEGTEDFKLKAYNKYGKLLTERSFKVKVKEAGSQTDVKVNDYLTTPDKSFGQTKTLYELISDLNFMNQIPVSELDKLGVTYALGNTAEVKDLEQLEMALANDKFKTIKLKTDIIGDVEINRNVTIDGNDKTITGDVTLKEGTEADNKNITVYMKKLDITGNLTFDVGATGTAVLEDVNVSGAGSKTEVINVGANSLHLHNFTSTNGIDLTNTSESRIVITGATGPQIKLSSDQKVTLEGLFDEISVNHADAKLTINNSSKEEIGIKTIDEGKKLTLKYPNQKSVVYDGNIVTESSGKLILEPLYPELENGMTVKDYNYSGSIIIGPSGTSDFFVIDDTTVTGLPKDLVDVTWTVDNKNVFGDKTIVKMTNDKKLELDNLPNETITKDVILRAEHNGEVHKIKVTVQVEVD